MPKSVMRSGNVRVALVRVPSLLVVVVLETQALKQQAVMSGMSMAFIVCPRLSLRLLELGADGGCWICVLIAGNASFGLFNQFQLTNKPSITIRQKRTLYPCD